MENEPHFVSTPRQFQEVINPYISDAKYAEELIFQEALMASLLFNNSSSSSSPSSSSSSSSSQLQNEFFLCEICTETKPAAQAFSVQNCDHHFCNDCIAKHIAVRLQKNPEHGPGFLSCPGLDCEGVLHIESCMGIVPEAVLIMWGDLICESMISNSQKFYCPYKDCSGLLVNDGGDGVEDEMMIRESECPFCRRLFCAACNVPWHAGVECEEFAEMDEGQRGREDLMVHELAKVKKWKRCGKCKFFVDKNQGCAHMTCRCGYQFCYGCGAPWSSTHADVCEFLSADP